MATRVPVIVSDLYGELALHEVEKWVVLHSKPRAEKKLVKHLLSLGITYYLPTRDSEHHYNNRKVVFQVPLFPGYVFARITEQAKPEIVQSGCIVGFIRVPEQEELINELVAIYRSKELVYDSEPGMWFEKGIEVEISSGPLKGIRGIVESQDNPEYVYLQVSILHSAVRVKTKAMVLKVLGVKR